MQDTFDDHTECEARVMNREASTRLLKALSANHDANMRPPKGWRKRERIEFVPPPVPSAEFKELWFGFDSEIPLAVKRELKIDEIKRIVCDYYDLTNIQLVSNRRSVETLRPRQIAAYFARNMTGRSLPEIGRRLGGRDHTTILSACRRVEALLLTDWKIAHDVAHLEIKLDEASSYPRSVASNSPFGALSQGSAPQGPHSVGTEAVHSPNRT
jgi:hypothetical protein